MSYGTSIWAPWVLEDEDKVMELMKAAYDAGIRTFDTADVYSNGMSEILVGKFIKKFSIPRQKLVILSKCFNYVGDVKEKAFKIGQDLGPEFINEYGLSRKHIFDAVDASLKRLGTYIDVLQIHRLDRSTPKEEIMEALHDVIKSGKVRYIGASSMRAVEFVQLQHVAELHGWTKFISMQNFYNLVYREEEREMIPYCNETGVGLIPWSPIARGILSRPLDSEPTLRQQTDRIQLKLTEGDQEVIRRVEKVAKDHGVSMALISTAWVLSKGASPIVGISKLERIDDAVNALSFKFTAEELAYLEEPYQPKNIVGYVAN